MQEVFITESLRQKDRAFSFQLRFLRGVSELLAGIPLCGYSCFFEKREDTFYERTAGYCSHGQRKGQRLCLGPAHAGAAGGHRYSDDGFDQGLSAEPFPVLDGAYRWRHFQKQARNGPYCQGGPVYQPVPEPLHRSGRHHRYRQHRRCCCGHCCRRSRGHFLDVDRGRFRHDDELLRERSGHLLPPEECRRGVVRRGHVLFAGRPGQLPGL